MLIRIEGPRTQVFVNDVKVTDYTEGQPVLLGLIMIAAHFIVEDSNIASIQRIKLDYENGPLRQRLARYHRDVDTAFRGWNDAWLDPRFRDFDITRYLQRIHVPILALQGEDDPYGTDEQIRILEANVQAPITTRLIAGARHSPHLEVMDVTLTADWFFSQLACSINDNAKQKHAPPEFVAVFTTANIHHDRVHGVGTVAAGIS